VTEPNDGGPAFPTVDANRAEGEYGTMGMSLRDWFAGQALAGLLSDVRFSLVNDTVNPVELYPSLAYQYADAMLVERAKAKEGK